MVTATSAAGHGLGTSELSKPIEDRRLRRWLLAIVALAVFLVAFLMELRVIGFGENLTASSRGGSLMEQGVLTAYGWWSLGRRAAVASLLVLLLIVVWPALRGLWRCGG